jgi:peroxiredoxin
MLKKVVFFLLLFPFLLHSQNNQNVTIKGLAKNYEYKDIGVYINTDYISNMQKQLTYSSVDSAGNFELKFSSKSIQYVTLKIEKNIASMFIEPNGNYEIMIYPPDSAEYFNSNIEHDVPISIKLKSKTEINALTMDYDKRFDDFLGVEYRAFVSRTPQIKIDSFKLAMDKYYAPVNNVYFKNYVTYSIASLQEKTKVGEKALYKRYLEAKPILYNHTEYMHFFNTFYKQKLEKFSLTKDGEAINFTINSSASFKATKEFLKRDEYLKNDTICELVLIKGMYEGYYSNSFKRKSIIAILQQIAVESTIDEHRQIAQNCLNSFSKLQKGSKAPYFELPDKNGVTHSLDELRVKKHVYLMFYDANCVSCLQQMKAIPALKKKYGDKIEFVSISTNKTNAELKNFCAKNPKYDWVFLYDNSAGSLKNEYEIITMPAYFLISSDGKFIQIPADSPEQDIEQVFYDLTKPKNKPHNIGSKENR